jgi:hypothetical protein
MWRGEALGQVVEALALAGDTQRAQETAVSISDPKYQAKALIKVAAAIASAGHREQANELFKQAASLLTGTQDEHDGGVDGEDVWA